MLLTGLTGGIGSGKSTVAAGLADRGASVIDADLVAREVVEPGGLAYDPLRERFGPAVLAEDGRLDRPALAAVVFGDPQALADLNAITHPAIFSVIGGRLAELSATDKVVVVDIPLLNESAKKKYRFDLVVVVDVPEEVAVARLVEHRGFTEADARARIAAQIGREERNALADVVIDNSGDRAALAAQIDQVWETLREAAATPRT